MAGDSHECSAMPNCSIWPVQLRDSHPLPASSQQPSSSNNRLPRKQLQYVPIDQLEFEDVSFFLNFDYLSKRFLGQGPSDEVNIKTEASDDDEPLFVSIKKRPIASTATSSRASTPNKKPKNAWSLERRSLVPLIDTSCIFRVIGREPSHISSILRLKESLSKTSDDSGLWLDNLDFEIDVLSRPEESLIGHQLQLSDRDHQTPVAILPVLTKQILDPSLRPDKVTNAEWLSAACQLDYMHAVDTRISLALTTPPSGIPPQHLTAGSLFLKLRIEVSVPVSSDEFAPLGSIRIMDMAKLVRFADPTVTVEEEKIRQSVIDATFIYQNLRPSTLQLSDRIQPVELEPTLLPFQKRSTAFVLGREGMQLDEEGNTIPTDSLMAHDGPRELGLWWKRLAPHLCYNWLEARFVQDAALTLSSNFKGAMLAEEMGLGKTVEAVALMLLNPDPEANQRSAWYNEANEIDVTPTSLTLIIAPETLRKQWIEEIGRHAPHLSFYSYTGRSDAEAITRENGCTWEDWAKRFDVMVTSYVILSRELSTAKSEKPRSRRHERKYERPRSPLVKLHFHRVIMDEVQMVGNSNAAETASMISRNSSLAVSGTPVKSMADLKACFRFLRVPGYLANNTEWSAIFNPLLAPALVQTLRSIATRHTKAQVAGEMLLPMQTRSVVPIDFTSIEAAFYADVWKDALAALQYSEDGKPQTANQQLDAAKMRQHLLLLRQACTHPQVAIGFRGGIIGSRNLRSIDEVLELMIDATKSDLHSNRYQWFERRILKNILSLYYKDEDRRIIAAARFRDIEMEIRQDVAELEAEIEEARMHGPLYKFSDEELELERRDEDRRRQLGYTAKELEDVENTGEAAAHGSDAWRQLCTNSAYREKRKQRAAHITTLKASLRNLLTRLHRLLQFKGNLYFQRGEHMDKQLESADETPSTNQEVRAATTATILREEDSAVLESKAEPNSQQDSSAGDNEVKEEPNKALGLTLNMSPERQKLKDSEDQAYVEAEKVRQRLLTDAREEVEAAVSHLNRRKLDLDLQSLRADEEIFAKGGGIATNDPYMLLSSSCDLLNQHAEKLLSWRDSIMTRLSRPVNRDINLEKDDDDQYQENLDTQAEAEVLLEMYRPLLSERELILKGVVPVGATSRPTLYAELEKAVKKARQDELRGIEPESAEDEELLRVQQQQLNHFKTLDEEKGSVSLSRPDHSFASISETLKGVRDNSIRSEEAALARQALTDARRIIIDQSRHLEKLRAEERTLLTALFNSRSKYFKEIQALSDTVRDPVFTDLAGSIGSAQRDEVKLATKVDELQRRLRYFLHLQKVQSGRELDEETKRCHVCTDIIQIGILTPCGHVSCESCWKEWRSQGHKTCLLCQTRVAPTDVHRIIYRQLESEPANMSTANGRTLNGTHPNGAPANGAGSVKLIFNEIEEDVRNRLNNMTIEGRFGSKIDQVTKHIRLIVDRTGEKSIVFSSFERGLDVVAQSLTANGIKHVRLTGASKVGGVAAEQFRSDPQTHVMLLHSEAQSAGLNLVSASHIHILEPLLNSTLELQAIGRVHRIGQTKETNVWCYYVKDTVEERILALAACKGQSLYVKGAHTSLSSASAETNAPESASRQDARNWAGLSKDKSGRSSGTLRGDYTTSNEELLACYFSQHLPRAQSDGISLSTLAHGSATTTSPNGDSTQQSQQAQSSSSRSTFPNATNPEEDERARLRAARLAAFERRTTHSTT